MTSDAATIIREIEVVHPAAKLLVMASQAQESEVWRSTYMRVHDVHCIGNGLDGRCYEFGSHSSWRTFEKS